VSEYAAPSHFRKKEGLKAGHSGIRRFDRVEKQAKLFDLPEYIVPHSLIAFGYPDEAPASRAPEWEEDRVHYEKW
jgi:nitroreductase